ncbi:MAG TPA: glycosyl hydrolase 108 family protein [Myxococcota bacterium]|nr:glycosyl hydrolase 108 family protein [Myxococcota bacterium]HRV18640.1 glycosyl hydrolase 108 family protein [Myxococcota bacterium]
MSDEYKKFVTIDTVRFRAAPGGEVLGLLKNGSILASLGPTVTRDGVEWLPVMNGTTAGYLAYSLVVPLPDEDFDRAIHFVLAQEGGFVDDPRDPGGRTNFGISQRAYPDLDIASLTKQQATEIYREDYWKRAGCAELPWPVNLAHFDFAVNAGIGAASKLLGESGGNFAAYLAARRAFYQSLNSFSVFGQGWMNRVNQLEDYVKRIG